MSEQLTINYDNGSNFSFDSDEIEIVGSSARLKLVPNPGQVFTQDFSSSTGFTYNPSLATFSAGTVTQLDQTPANSVMASQLTTKDLNWRNGAGSLVGTLNGTPTFSAGAMTCLNTQGVSYTRTSSALETWKIKYRPGYSGTPSVNRNIFSCSGSVNNDRVFLTHSPSGDNFRISLNNASGTQIYIAQTIGASGINLSSSTTYELELTIDSTSGVVRLFVDGNIHGTLTPGTWTRGATALNYFVGADSSSAGIYNTANATFDDYIVFSDIQHTSAYTSGYSIPVNKYLESKIDLPAFSYTGVGTLLSIDSSTTTESGTPRYIIGGLYWNGSIWTPSDTTYAQANDSATVIANLTEINLTGASSAVVSVVFGNSNTISLVDLITVSMTGQIYPSESTIVYNTAIETDALISLSETSTLTGGTIKYIMVVDALDKYHNGSAWVSSNGTSAQANTLAEVNAAAASLLSQGAALKIKAVLIKGSTTPALTTNVATYSFYGGIVADPTKVVVYEYVRDLFGEKSRNIVLSVELKRAYTIDSQLITPGLYEFKSDESGYVEAEIVKNNAAGPGYYFQIKYEDQYGILRKVIFNEVAVTEDARISSITSVV